jgi:hypothetical protein
VHCFELTSTNLVITLEDFEYSFEIDSTLEGVETFATIDDFELSRVMDSSTANIQSSLMQLPTIPCGANYNPYGMDNTQGETGTIVYSDIFPPVNGLIEDLPLLSINGNQESDCDDWGYLSY